MIYKVIVMWNNDHTTQMEKLDIDVDPSEYERREMTFYKVDAIAPNVNYGKLECTSIHVGGDVWVTPTPYNEVAEQIEKLMSEVMS